MSKWRAFIDRIDFNYAMQLRLGEERSDGRLAVLKAPEWIVLEPNTVASDDNCLRLPEPEMRGLLQALMDESWRIGIRPQEPTADTVIAAKDRHLADMRALAFYKIGAELPK